MDNFDTWFDAICEDVYKRTGVRFRDAGSVREDFDAGRDAFDVSDEICDEFS